MPDSEIKNSGGKKIKRIRYFDVGRNAENLGLRLQDGASQPVSQDLDSCTAILQEEFSYYDTHSDTFQQSSTPATVAGQNESAFSIPADPETVAFVFKLNAESNLVFSDTKPPFEIDLSTTTGANPQSVILDCRLYSLDNGTLQSVQPGLSNQDCTWAAFVFDGKAADSANSGSSADYTYKMNVLMSDTRDIPLIMPDSCQYPCCRPKRLVVPSQ